MKKAGMLVLLLGMLLAIPGCGFTEGTDAVVTVVRATPTPTPSPTPAVTATPTPTPTPAVVYEQTPSGLQVEVKEGTYVTTTDVNLRDDAMAEGVLLTGIASGTTLTATGVVENGWIRTTYTSPNDGQTYTGYVSGDYVQETEAAEATEEAAQ